MARLESSLTKIQKLNVQLPHDLATTILIYNLESRKHKLTQRLLYEYS